jgi:hypothetical protein
MRARVASAITAATLASRGSNGAGEGEVMRHQYSRWAPGRELVFLERVDFVADEAGDGHGDFSCGDERSLEGES